MKTLVKQSKFINELNETLFRHGGPFRAETGWYSKRYCIYKTTVYMSINIISEIVIDG